MNVVTSRLIEAVSPFLSEFSKEEHSAKAEILSGEVALFAYYTFYIEDISVYDFDANWNNFLALCDKEDWVGSMIHDERIDEMVVNLIEMKVATSIEEARAFLYECIEIRRARD